MVRRQLLSASAALLARRGYERFVVYVLAENHHAVRLYQSEGCNFWPSRSRTLC